MLSIGAAVKATLVAGGIPSNLIFAQIAPEGATQDLRQPSFVTYRHLKTEFDYGKPVGFSFSTAQVAVHAWASTVEKATELAKQCFDAMQEYRGDIGGVEVQEVRLHNVMDMIDTDAMPLYYAKVLVFRIVF